MQVNCKHASLLRREKIRGITREVYQLLLQQFRLPEVRLTLSRTCKMEYKTIVNQGPSEDYNDCLRLRVCRRVTKVAWLKGISPLHSSRYGK